MRADLQYSPSLRPIAIPPLRQGRFDFPGNVRELSSMIERGIIYAKADGKA